MTTRILLATAAAILLAAPATAQSEARALPMSVSAEWLAERLNEPDLLVVQVDQRRDGYDAGHIPGAQYLAYGRIAVEVEGIPVELPPVETLREALEEVGVRDGVRVVLYGAPLSAARAWMTLDYLGISDRAAVLDGGIAAWRAAGRPVSTEPRSAPTGTLTVSPQPEIVVEADWVHVRLDDPGYVLIDARPLDEYTGADGGGSRPLTPGHIPGARHLHWEDLIHSTSDPRLLSEDRLRELYEEAGASDQLTVVVYCTIGMRASMAYFVARMLGYETRFYDGSWFDWSERGMPAEEGPDRRATGG
jgi:thiosulfate/3-mercaptopyruvate sulfurtransferase